MYIFIWIILLASHVDADQPSLPACDRGYCVTISEEKISAEAGLCAIINCSFNVPWDFIPSSAIWYKCGHRCKDADSVIIHSPNQNEVHPSFSGRVSQLEPDLRHRNCSIIINDLQFGDSGKYYMRLINRYNSGFSFNRIKTAVTVKALRQKPTVWSPALSEGLNASLSCTAPGLCSGARPRFTWTWRGAGEAPPSVTTTTTDRLTPVSHQHSSTLELRPSADLHGAELSCTVSYNDSFTEDSIRINVSYVRDIAVSGDTAVKEGDSLNVTCSVDSFPPSWLSWFGPNRTSLNLPEITDLGSASLLIHNITAAQSGQYLCEGLHDNGSQTRSINISVTYVRAPVLSGNTSVGEGRAMTLNCTVDSFPPPSSITLRRRGISMNSTQTDPGSVSLTVSSVTAEDAGRYECTVEHELRTLSTSVDVEVFLMPHILNSSGCVVFGDVLSCTCVSWASPLPTVTWPLIRHLSEYTLVTTVTGETANSSLVLKTSAQHNLTGVQCVSGNQAGQVQEVFTPSVGSVITEPPTTPEKLMRVVSRLEVIVAFLTGFILASVLCCVVIKCHRKKQTIDLKEGDWTETLEMVNGGEEPEHNGYALEVAEANTEPGELHYASINFSAMTQKARGKDSREETKTEYAEIKREVMEEWPMLEEMHEELSEDPEAAMMDDSKQIDSVKEEEEEEEEALYSNVKEILANE